MQPVTPNRLQIRTYPFILWIVGGIFIFVGVSLLIQQSSAWAGSLLFIIGALIALVLGNITTIIIDKDAGTISLRNRTIFRNVIKEYAINEIASVEVEHSRSDDGGTTYRIAFINKNGESLPFHSYYTSGYNGKERQAKKIRDFLGLTGTSTTTNIQSLIKVPNFQLVKDDITSGVSWRLERSSLGNTEITRWFSSAFQLSSGFLLIVQIPKASKLFSGFKMPGMVSRFLYEQIIKIYDIPLEATPGLENATLLEPAEPRLEPYFATLTSDPYSARQALNPWVVLPLLQWAELHPIETIQDSSTLGQLVVLFSPQGIYLVSMGGLSAEQVGKLVGLGVELVKAQGG